MSKGTHGRRGAGKGLATEKDGDFVRLGAGMAYLRDAEKISYPPMVSDSS